MRAPNRGAARDLDLPSRRNSPPAKVAAHASILASSVANSNDTRQQPALALFEALTELVRSAVASELEQIKLQLAEPRSEYRDRHAEAQRLGISLSTLDRLCRDGMPFVHVGDSRRFRASDVDAWLTSRSRESEAQ